MTLSAQEIEFVKIYVRDFCSDAFKAYVLAFGVEITNDDDQMVAMANAKKLLKHKEVQQLLEEERRKFINNYKLTKEQLTYKIAKIQRKTEKEEDYNTSLKALDMLGKIVGAYQPEQQVNILINQSDRDNINAYLFGNSEPKQVENQVSGLIEEKNESEEKQENVRGE